MQALPLSKIRFDIKKFNQSLLESGYDETGAVCDIETLPRYDRRCVESALRSPSWRAQRAHDLQSDGGRFSPEDDGPITTAYLRMLGLRERGERHKITREDFAKLCPIHLRSMLAAEEYYERATSWQRACLEARILGRQPFDQIAELVSLSRPAIHWYERLFFQIADRLKSSDWVIGHVIGPMFQSGIESVTQEQLLRYCGFIAGPHLVDQLVNGGMHRQLPTNVAELHAFLDNSIQLALKVQTFSSGVTMKPGRFDVSPLLDSFAQQQAIDIRSSGMSEQADWIETLVKKASREVKIPRGSEAATIPKDSPLRNYAVGHVELRASEQGAFSNGGLPYLQKLAAFKPPAPQDAFVQDRDEPV